MEITVAVQNKDCGKCGHSFPLLDDFWYRARPTVTHPRGGWQSNCKDCWKSVNKANKEKRRLSIVLKY